MQGNYLVKLDKKGNFIWGFHTITGDANSYGYRSEVRDMVVDKNGNSSLLVFINEEGSMTYEGITVGGGEYLFHFNSSGDLLWVKTFNQGVLWTSNVQFDRGMYNLGVDGAGNIYLIGKKKNQDNGGNGASDLAMTKLDESGTHIWTKLIEGKNSEVNYDMFVSYSGDILLTGAFMTEINFGGIKLESSALQEMYVAKYNSDGMPVWATSPGTSNASDQGMQVVQDESGNVFFTSQLRGTDPYFGGESLGAPGDVLAMLDGESGELLWQRTFSDAFWLSFAWSNELLANDGRVYLSTMMDNLKLLPGENFEASGDDHLIIEFDYTGQIVDINNLGYFYYSTTSFVPIARTSDNGLILPDNWGYFSIVKTGYMNRKSIDLNSVEAFLEIMDGNGCVTLLNNLEIDVPAPQAPSICYIASEAGGNLLHWSNSGADDISVFNIYRETYQLGNYELIGTVPSGETTFLDGQVDNDVRSYRYVISAEDACQESNFSEYHGTMHLTVNEGNLGQINLIWDGYEGIDYKSFKIYRGNSASELELLAEVPSYLFTYTDVEPSPSTQYYQIRIESNLECTSDSNSSGRKGRVVSIGEIGSNITVRFGEAGNLRIYPNPGNEGVNIKFDPDGELYKMELIDHNGRMVRKVEGIFNEGYISRGSLPTGIYTIILRNNLGKVLYSKVVFE